MTPAKLPIQEAIVTRLSGALSAEVGTDPGIPGIEVGDDDETYASENTSSVHTDASHTIRSRAYSEVTAKTNGQKVVTELTDRSNLLSLPSPFSVLRATLTGHDMQRTRRTEGPDIFTDITIITFRITRS